MSEPTAVSSESAIHVSQTLRALVAEISELTQSDAEPRQFHTEFLDRVIAGLSARAGAVWLRSPEGDLELHVQIDLDRVLGLDEPGDRLRHKRLLSQVAQSGQALLLPYPQQGGSQMAGEPSPFVLLSAPLVVEDEVLGVVEVAQQSGSSSASQAGYLRFLAQLCSLAGDYHERRRGSLLRDQQQSWHRFNDLVRAVHESLDVRLAAYTIANEGCRYIGCDRLDVAVQRGRSFRVEAISGEDLVNPRTNVVRLLNRLVRAVMKGGEPLWYSGGQPGGHLAGERSLPPQIELALQDYVDQSHAKCVAVLPLTAGRGPSHKDAPTRPPAITGALILEQFTSDTFSEPQRSRAEVVSQHAAASLNNALQYNSIFLLPLWKLIGKASWIVQARTLPRTLVGLLLVAAAVLALLFVPADFEIEAPGRLEPEVRRDVFAAMDGLIEEVRVTHGQKVTAGTVLAVLRNTQHELQLAAVLGDLQTVGKQLAASRASLLTVSRQSAEGRSRYPQLAAEIEQLTVRQQSLEEQRDLLVRQAAELTVTSPIGGQVITWDVTDLLAARPVQRGQILLRVADTDGPWILELDLPDRRDGQVRAARQALRGDLDVSFLMATDPGTTCTGKIRDMAMSAEVHDELGSSVRVTVAIEPGRVPDLRPGATVTAKIHCGRRSVGYVWFHGLIEFVQSRVLFKL